MDEVIQVVEKYASIVEIQGNHLKVIFHEDPDNTIKAINKELISRNIVFKVTKDDDYYILTFARVSFKKNNIVIPIILLLLTIFTTLIAGALQQGFIPWENWSDLVKGIPFSFSVILVLGIHELAHFLASKKNGVAATLPYFIPFPNPLIGTMGAFIRVKTPISDRKSLVEIGSAGPIAGFIMAIPLTIIGLLNSSVGAIHEGMVSLGTPLIFEVLSRICLGKIPESYALILNPMAFAGWLGFFVTGLNLLPVGQLDGGHVLYGILGTRYHNILSKAILIILIPLGFLWNGWWVWAVLLLILGTKHPEPLYEENKLSTSTNILGIVSLLIFILTFVPSPIRIAP
ncbi:MAG TPA: site-2 protease family protein [Candidatus Hydrothermia bacterium]|nr:site-2 protease family protein [Candidatus Hydrothermia bacterium]